MEKWEYMTEFVWANIDSQGIREFLNRNWPSWKNPPKFTPETMIPRLNKWGEDGWELVHMEPVLIGSNHDINTYTGAHIYTNVYFCVFKRPKQ
jgi:hypothetical protein